MVFDLLFREASVPDEDNAFRKAILDSPSTPVVLATEETRSESTAEAPGGFRYWFFQPIFAQQAPNVTVASAKAFDPSGLVEGAILVARDEQSQQDIPHLGLSAAIAGLLVGDSPPKWNRDTGEVVAGSRRWPVGEDGEFYASWTRSPGEFEIVEYSHAMELLATSEGKRHFSNRIVLIGDFTGDDDHRSAIGKISGTEVIANISNSLLSWYSSGSYRWRIPANLAWCITVGFLAAWFAGTLRLRPILFGIPLVLASTVCIPAAAQTNWRIWIDTVAPILTVITSGSIGAALAGIDAGRLARRLTPTHIREARVSGQTEIATVLFVDLGGSTAMAEQLGPIPTQRVLSEMLLRIEEVVGRHGGEVERTLGDGVMAVFRGSEPLMHASACLELVKRLPHELALTMSRMRTEGYEPYLTAGMETGEIAGAAVRSGGLEEWSSFGPTVNLASRLQGAAASSGVRVVIGPCARELLKDVVELRALERVRLKGVSNPVQIYTLNEEGSSTL